MHAVRIGDRFIPAYAGNAILASAADKPLKVHPRIRGERCRELDRKYYDSGSSPHTRGTLPASASCSLCPRFIPAYAGNAASPMIFAPGQTVHPRIRGERPRCDRPLLDSAGSSPHTRGTPVSLDGGGGRPRFIPAYAGNARKIGRSMPSLPVHPRIRGERA